MFWTYPAVPCIDSFKEKHDNIEKKKRKTGTSYRKSTPALKPLLAYLAPPCQPFGGT